MDNSWSVCPGCPLAAPVGGWFGLGLGGIGRLAVLVVPSGVTRAVGFPPSQAQQGPEAVDTSSERRLCASRVTYMISQLYQSALAVTV